MKAAPFAAWLMLAACSAAAPDGQVAARVDDIEITDRELTAEAAASGANLADPSIRAALLDRLIDRKLLARASQATLADRTPAAQIDARRTREESLARAYARRVTAGIEPPDAAAIARFMRDNPHRFALRTSYVFDRLSGSAGAQRRQLILIDTASLSAAEARRIAALAPSQTVRRSPVTLDTLIMKQPVVETPAAQRARARAMIMSVQSALAIKNKIRELRASAKIIIRTQER